MSEYGGSVRAWRRHPEFFARAVLGASLWSKQVEVLTALRDHRRVAVRSGHGIGKSYVAAVAALWWLTSHPQSRVITTAPTWTQVRDLLWREIRMLHAGARMPIGGDMQQTRLELDDKWFATGASTDRPESFQGHHATSILLIADEASGIADDIFEAGEGFLTSEHSRLLLIGNPTQASGQFYRAFHSERSLWDCHTISVLDSPAFTAEQFAHADKLTQPQWVDEHRKLWGEDSPLWHVRVLGEFPSLGDDAVISLALVEAAQRRSVPPPERGVEEVVACDVARFGADSTVIVTRRDRRVRVTEVYNGRDLMRTCGAIIRAAEQCTGTPRIVVDDDGVGGGVTDRLREQGHTVEGFRAGAKAYDDKHYYNRRAELWFNGADEMKTLDLDPDEQLAADLVASKYTLDSKGRLQIEPKEKTKQRLGRSPDKADAALMSLTQPRRRRVPDIGPSGVTAVSAWR